MVHLGARVELRGRIRGRQAVGSTRWKARAPDWYTRKVPDGLTTYEGTHSAVSRPRRLTGRKEQKLSLRMGTRVGVPSWGLAAHPGRTLEPPPLGRDPESARTTASAGSGAGGSGRTEGGDAGYRCGPSQRAAQSCSTTTAHRLSASACARGGCAGACPGREGWLKGRVGRPPACDFERSGRLRNSQEPPRSLGPVSGGKPRPAPRTPGKAQVWPRASEGTKRSPV